MDRHVSKHNLPVVLCTRSVTTTKTVYPLSLTELKNEFNNCSAVNATHTLTYTYITTRHKKEILARNRKMCHYLTSQVFKCVYIRTDGFSLTTWKHWVTLEAKTTHNTLYSFKDTSEELQTFKRNTHSVIKRFIGLSRYRLWRARFVRLTLFLINDLVVLVSYTAGRGNHSLIVICRVVNSRLNN